ncbi:hypothetical protein NMG60_11008898 [Bertholletia excelsa]
MAGAATATQFMSLTGTHLCISPCRPYPKPSFSLRSPFPHVRHRRTTNNGGSGLVSFQRTEFNASAGEIDLEDIDDAFEVTDEEYENEEEEDDDAESSVDLLLKFLQSMFKKVSKRVRKASRSVLPAAIPPQLVSFAVDGVLLLASLSILKALLEVACTIGGTVFVVILLLRVIWTAISYFQSSGNSFNQSGSSYGRAQPVT